MYICARSKQQLCYKSASSLPDKRIPPPSKLNPTAELQDVVATLPRLRKKLRMEQHPPLPRILNTVARFWVSRNGQVLHHRVGASVRRERRGVKRASSSPRMGCSHPSQMDLFCKAEEEGNFAFCFIATAYNLGEPQEVFLLHLTGCQKYDDRK